MAHEMHPTLRWHKRERVLRSAPTRCTVTGHATANGKIKKKTQRRDAIMQHNGPTSTTGRIEGFNDWGGQGHDDFVPGEVI